MARARRGPSVSTGQDGDRAAAGVPGLPLVSVIVPHYNDLANLACCLEHLRQQTWPADCREIIVADNNSQGGVPAVERLASDVRVVPAPEQGAGPARNAAVAVARGEVLAFIDSDCFAAPSWLAEGVAALARFDYVGGQVQIAVPDPRRPTPAEAYEAVFAFDFRKYIEQERFSGTGNLFVPRAVFDRVGGFRSGVSEDIDWCRRANALGYRLGYAEKALVRHPARRRWGELTRRWDRVIGEMLALGRERPGWRWRWLLYALAVAGSPLPHALRILRSRRLGSPRSKIAGLFGLFGIRWYRGYRMLACLWRSAARPR
jgi:cellulose synthase/poly-beta-1,6-N-acetylglucosamine synthase-like glycosyltransferase